MGDDLYDGYNDFNSALNTEVIFLVYKFGLLYLE
jgi:hypothetical protein